MAGKQVILNNTAGLNKQDIQILQQKYGKNVFTADANNPVTKILWNTVKEPMFIMLITACLLYFLLSQVNEGFLMLTAMLFVATISFYQEVKSSKALQALSQLTQAKSVVVRNGEEIIIDIADLVPGDIVMLEEGNKVPADAILVQGNDLTIDESILTGESLPVEKDEQDKKILYQGTTINSGKCYAKIFATGNNTAVGKLGKSITDAPEIKSLLQRQITIFVKKLALFGIAAFIVIFAVNFLKDKDFINSLLLGLTIAMAAIPEEIPVAFSSFMALGAYQMTKSGIISRQPQTIENIGAVTVICLDKTGTITENKMEVKNIYDHKSGLVFSVDENPTVSSAVLFYATLACETEPFDPMEKAISKAYEKYSEKKFINHQIVYEYPLEGKPPMMTHLYKDGNKFIVAGKGAAERILSLCNLDKSAIKEIEIKLKEFSIQGYRVIAVASAEHTSVFPSSQNNFHWTFEGLLSLNDPPKKGIKKVFSHIYNAGIAIKLLTGDYAETALNIAEQVGISNFKHSVNGEEVMAMNNAELKKTIYSVDVFARMFPEAKLKVIEALKLNGETVAMTGDGVNDGPALKSADIGIAMGKKGTEIARQAADLIITDDKLEKVSEAIEYGRKIFTNFKKAVRYIISIHIPIILTASLPLLLNWKYPNIFTPIHVIFLEIIMGPTCSIFFEREPAEKNIMHLHPRDPGKGLYTAKEILLSIGQGLAITTGILILYYYYMKNGSSLSHVRSMVFTTLITANIFLTFSNRSFNENIFKTIRYKNNLALIVITISVCFLLAINLIPSIRNLFEMSPISFDDFIICLLTAIISVGWIEIYKTSFKNTGATGMHIKN